MSANYAREISEQRARIAAGHAALEAERDGLRAENARLRKLLTCAMCANDGCLRTIDTPDDAGLFFLGGSDEEVTFCGECAAGERATVTP